MACVTRMLNTCGDWRTYGHWCPRRDFAKQLSHEFNYANTGVLTERNVESNPLDSPVSPNIQPHIRFVTIEVFFINIHKFTIPVIFPHVIQHASERRDFWVDNLLSTYTRWLAFVLWRNRWDGWKYENEKGSCSATSLVAGTKHKVVSVVKKQKFVALHERWKREESKQSSQADIKAGPKI